MESGDTNFVIKSKNSNISDFPLSQLIGNKQFDFFSSIDFKDLVLIKIMMALFRNNLKFGSLSNL